MHVLALASIRRAAVRILGAALCVLPALALAQSCVSPNADSDYILWQMQGGQSATSEMAMHWQTGLVWNRCQQGFAGSCGFSALNNTWNDWASAYLPRPFPNEFAWGVSANQDLIGGGVWRMPYMSELLSIGDGCGFPKYNGDVFSSTGSLAVWSGSPYPTSDKAWYVDFTSGVQASNDRGSVMPIRLVRGGVPFAPLPSSDYSKSSAPGQSVAFGPISLIGNGGQAWGGARITGGTFVLNGQGVYSQAIVTSGDAVTVLVTAPTVGNSVTATLTLHSAQTFGTDQAGPGNEITQMQEFTATFTVQSPGFSIGGTVSGLTGVGLVLQNNGGDDLAVSGSTFTFPGRIGLSGSYNVTVKTQPVGQTCTVSNGSGSNVNANVNNVAVACAASTYSIGGNVSGLSGSGLALQNGSESLPISANGGFTFATKVTYGGSYAVTVKTQPVGQTCTVANGSGSNVSANVSNVAVTCVVNTYSIGGTVSGLTGTGLVLQNGNEPLSISGNGNFAFATKVPYGGSYNVTVKSQPNNGQSCSIANGSGSATADVSNVQVTCINLYVIRGSVSGLFFGSTVVLQNGSEVLTIPGGGTSTTFTFATKVPEGGSYNVVVKTQPSAQTCTVANGSGSSVMADVTNVAVTCTAPQATLNLVATPDVLVPGTSSTLTASGGSGGGALTYSLDSGPCSVSGNLAIANGVGNCIVRATKAADIGYESATATATITVQEAPQLTLHLNNGSDFACYGCIAEYVVTLTNTGGTATAVPVQFSVSQGIDLQHASVACSGDQGTNCTQDASDPLHFTVTLPANSSVTWLLDLPVRADAAEAAITLDANATGASPLNQASTLVLFRDGFDDAASTP